MLDHCDVFNHDAKVGTKKSRRKNYSVGWELVGVAVGVEPFFAAPVGVEPHFGGSWWELLTLASKQATHL